MSELAQIQFDQAEKARYLEQNGHLGQDEMIWVCLKTMGIHGV